MNSNLKPDILLRLVVTISGNSISAEQTVQVDPDANLTSGPLSTESLTPARETIDHPAPIASDHGTEEIDEAEKVQVFKEAAQLEPHIAQRADRLPGDQTDIGTSAVDGLVSIMFNLDGIMKIVDILADVRNALSLYPPPSETV